MENWQKAWTGASPMVTKRCWRAACWTERIPGGDILLLCWVHTSSLLHAFMLHWHLHACYSACEKKGKTKLVNKRIEVKSQAELPWCQQRLMRVKRENLHVFLTTSLPEWTGLGVAGRPGKKGEEKGEERSENRAQCSHPRSICP